MPCSLAAGACMFGVVVAMRSHLWPTKLFGWLLQKLLSALQHEMHADAEGGMCSQRLLQTLQL